MTRRTTLVIATALGALAVVAIQRARRAGARARRPADVAFMHAMHAALRRDVARLGAVALDANGSRVPGTVREGFAAFRRELEFHHRAEDEDLWPLLREHAPSERVDVTINAMISEHAQIPPALDRVASALEGDADLREPIAALSTVVEEHLEHEEEAALPLIERYLDDAAWHDFLRTERRKRPASERPMFLAWVLDDATPQDARAVLRELPPPGRLAYRRIIKPRYDARRLWSTDEDSAATERPIASYLTEPEPAFTRS